MFLDFFKKKQKKVENNNVEVTDDNKDNKTNEKKQNKENSKPNSFAINSNIVNLLIDSNINVNVESTNGKSYCEVIVDDCAEIEKFDAIEQDKTLKIDLKVNQKKNRTSSSNSTVCTTTTTNVYNSSGNICINSSNVCITNTSGSISYRTSGNWELNVYINKNELHNLSVNTTSSDINVDINVQKVQINTVSGDIECENVTKEAHLKSTSGDITVTCNGEYQNFDIDAKSVSGDIDICLNKVKQINKKINTVSGDIDVDCELNGDVIYNIKVNTVSGDITIQDC